jgi:hypothetical protein
MLSINISRQSRGETIRTSPVAWPTMFETNSVRYGKNEHQRTDIEVRSSSERARP